MADLDFPSSPSDGDTYEGYVYNAAKGVWQWQTLSPSLVSLTDTDISSPSSGEVLEYDGTNWVNAAAAGGGKILQVVRATDTSNSQTSSATAVDTGLSITITPTKSNSTIIVVATFLTNVGNPDANGNFLITDSADNALSGSERGRVGQSVVYVPVTLVGYSSPATTSPTTYKVRFYQDDTGIVQLVGASQTSQMFAIEVAA